MPTLSVTVPTSFILHLFDDLVGSDEQSRRDFEAKCFGGLLVDPQLERGRKLDRHMLIISIKRRQFLCR